MFEFRFGFDILLSYLTVFCLASGEEVAITRISNVLAEFNPENRITPLFMI